MAQPVRTKGFSFKGGLDIVSNVLEIEAGKAFAMENMEPWYNGGYRRIRGYEIFDGRPRPSDATITGFDLVDTTGLSVGDTLTGDSSGATMVVCGIDPDSESIAVTKLVGTMQQGEFFNTAAYQMAVTPSYAINQAPTVTLEKEWRLAAENEYRGDIGQPAGEGEVRGIWRRKADTYAWRNNVGSTIGVMQRATTSGWTTSGITLAHYVYFDGGVLAGATLAEGDTVTDAITGTSATVHRVILHDGAWDGSAEGYLVLTDVTGGSGQFDDGNNIQKGGITQCVAASNSAQFGFSAGGTYQFHNHNFFASATTFRAYGCNGLDPAFEIDENRVVSPILFPLVAATDQPALNRPFLIEEHRNHLFVAFEGGTFHSSVVGLPMQFNGFLGATEFGMGDEITGMDSVAGNVMVVKTDRETRGLYGNNINDWDFRLLGEQTGGKLYTSQKIDTVYGLDDLGITNLSRTEAFGDYVAATVGQLINPYLDSRRDIVTCSVVNRQSNQYRVYFSDGTAIVMYLPIGSIHFKNRAQKLPDAHFSVLNYPLPVLRMYNTEDENGTERTYFCSNDGYVYEDQVGRNFNGAKITAYARLAFNHMGSPGMRKRFRKLDLEIQSSERVTCQVLADLDYGAPDIAGEIITVSGGGGYWDSASWDEITWDGQGVSDAEVKITGIGINIGILILSDTNTEEPFTLQSCNIHFEPKRLNR